MKFAPPSVKQLPHVHCWGDSTTNALFSTSAYAPYSGIGVFRARAISGGTSTQIIANWPTQLAITPNMPNEFAIFWLGRNNITDPSTVLADTALMVSRLTHENFLVLSVLNGGYPGEVFGGPYYHWFTDYWSSIQTIYGTKALDIRSLLVSDYNIEIPQDVTDHNNDVVPTSLRADNIHPNSAGSARIAAHIVAKLHSDYPQFF